MPAVLSANLHSGFLNEEYGLFLLRQIAAVAPIGRAEDFGIDAVVTLLPLANGFLHASDTFLIQLKSASVKVIEYGAPDKHGENQEHIKGELNWLRSLQLPLFFGSASRVEEGEMGKLKIYTSQNLMHALSLPGDLTAVNCCFHEADEKPTSQDAQSECERLKLEGTGKGLDHDGHAKHVADGLITYFAQCGTRTLWLGPPVLEVDLLDLSNQDQRENLIAVLQQWVRMTYRNVLSSAIGIYRPLKWKTNEMPEFWNGWDNISRPSDPHRMQAILEACQMPLQALTFEHFTNGTDEEIDTLRKALAILRTQGIAVATEADLDYLQRWAKENKS